MVTAQASSRGLRGYPFESAQVTLAALAYCPSADQRGVPRPLGAACDLGAFERWGRLFLPLLRR